MKSVAIPEFWNLYNALPADIRMLAVKNFRLWLENPMHASLHFKPISGELWSVRVGAHYRAIGKFVSRDTFVWSWIGSHAEYDNLR